MVDERALGPDRRPEERRAPEPLLYRPEQLVGRRPIRLRRRSDKVRLAGHLVAVALLVGLSVWWVVPLHVFAGPVLVTLSASHGVHAGDLAVFAFLAAATRSMVLARELVVGRS